MPVESFHSGVAIITRAVALKDGGHSAATAPPQAQPTTSPSNSHRMIEDRTELITGPSSLIRPHWFVLTARA
ncbi:hypothetical protein GCM10027289_05280 [Tsukamurella serpentis]